VPVGVVGVICPWNLPLLLLTWKVAPALAAGNAVVVKPSSDTPGTATLLAEVMRDAGVPPGVYNLIHGPGKDVGDALARHPGIDAITFTGESRTGQSIMAAASSRVKPVSFELGGKNAALVFADSDVPAAVAGVCRSTFTNTGQVCLCTERVYVERPIFDEFVSRLRAAGAALRLGPPEDDNVTTGPLISRHHRDKVLEYYRLAKAEGATVVLGGGVPDMGPRLADGAWIEPTIWVGLSESARCIREEVFGPVCHVAPFDTEEEAVALANDSEYGLAASVWTQNLARAHRVSAALQVGIAWVNTWFLRDLRTPFGGVRLSGIGREGGEHSLDFYSELRTVCIKL
jgi:aminomuconate-semialdehyde/2-hydroxymuconate-6-semialdehyde dehydrogenase